MESSREKCLGDTTTFSTPPNPHMIWIAPSEKDTATTLEMRLRNAADPFWTNSGLHSLNYSQPALGVALDQDTFGCNSPRCYDLLVTGRIDVRKAPRKK